MLDFNNVGPQRPHTDYFGGMANDQARQASGGEPPPPRIASVHHSDETEYARKKCLQGSGRLKSAIRPGARP
jgi:hypothetical protein